MDEDEYTDEAIEVTPAKWHWSFLAMRTLCFGANVANAVRCYLGEVAQDVGSYANYQMEQDERKQFAGDAVRELETLLGGDDG